MTIELIQIQGSPEAWIESFSLSYASHISHDLEIILGLSGEILEFPGLNENTTTLDIQLQPFQAKIVRLEPLAFHNEMFLRWQLYGCERSGNVTPTIFLFISILSAQH